MCAACADDLLLAYRKQVESELSDVCLDVLNLLEDTLVKTNTKENEARVFYLKMTGGWKQAHRRCCAAVSSSDDLLTFSFSFPRSLSDYYRYLAEFVTDKAYEQKAADYYKQAQEISTKVLEPTHPIRLGLALNYSVCFYEILKDKKAACELAKSAFDQAISGLDKLPEVRLRNANNATCCSVQFNVC